MRKAEHDLTGRAGIVGASRDGRGESGRNSLLYRNCEPPKIRSLFVDSIHVSIQRCVGITESQG